MYKLYETEITLKYSGDSEILRAIYDEWPGGCGCSSCESGRRQTATRILQARGEAALVGGVWRPVRDAASGAKTQKVRGLSALRWAEQYTGGNAYAYRSWLFASADVVINNPAAASQVPFPCFLRPCPEVPRHGFVDSRKVRNAEELLAVAREAYAADPNAELLVCGFIKGGKSAVVTPGTFSLGDGNDGATSGQSETVYGPYSTSRAASVEQLRQKATIAEGDVPYVELVEDETVGHFEIVQVRGGPTLAATQDYVPEDTKVKHVLVATENTDLLKWERDISAAGPGTVVYGKGLSLASHFCVHAVVHKIPVLTTFEPKIGETVKATDVPVWGDREWKRLARFLTEADEFFAAHRLGRGWCALATLALHCAGFPAPATDPQLRMLAYGAVSALKHLSAACIGEARHATECTHYDSGSGRSVVSYGVIERARSRTSNRDAYYGRAALASIGALRIALRATGHVYNYRKWRSGYGGKKWASINAAARRMADTIVAFRRRPSPERWAKLVAAWNDAIHREHNGNDTAFGKFGFSKSVMDAAAQWPIAQLSRLSAERLSVIFDGPNAADVAKGRDNLISPAPDPAKPKAIRVSIPVSVQAPHDATITVKVFPRYSYRAMAEITDPVLSASAKYLAAQLGGSRVTANMVVEGVASTGSYYKQAADTLARIVGMEAEDSTIAIKRVVSLKFAAINTPFALGPAQVALNTKTINTEEMEIELDEAA